VIKYHSRYLDDREKLNRWADPRLQSVRVSQLRSYLLSKAWKEVSPDRPGFCVFEEPTADGEERLYQFVPESDDWDGYPAQVYDLIAAVAAVEDRYAGDVLSDILREPADGESNGIQRVQGQRATKAS